MIGRVLAGSFPCRKRLVRYGADRDGRSGPRSALDGGDRTFALRHPGLDPGSRVFLFPGCFKIAGPRIKSG